MKIEKHEGIYENLIIGTGLVGVVLIRIRFKGIPINQIIISKSSKRISYRNVYKERTILFHENN